MPWTIHSQSPVYERRRGHYGIILDTCGHPIRYMKILMDIKPWKKIAMLALPPHWLARLTVINTGQPEGLVYFNKLMTDIIEKCRKLTDASNNYTDFLQLLLDANKDTDAGPEDCKSSETNYVIKGNFFR